MPASLDFVAARPHSLAARLDPGSIHLWRISYAASQGRTPLVALLAAYLGVPAESVVLDQGARGKPRLVHHAVSDRGWLDFNWSHSGDFALIALSRGCAVGVDIERLGKNLRALEIARRFFDPLEADALASLDREARDRAFMGLWCAKEAVLKAAGTGLSFGLARLAFAWRADAEWELTRLDPALGHVDDWQLAGFDTGSGYRGALAWRGAARKIVALQPADTAIA